MTSSSRQWIIVPDEWLVHDIQGDNGVERRQEAERFLVTLIERCDRFLLRCPSLFTKKAYALMEDKRREVRRISRILHGEVLRDWRKTTFLYEGVPIPQELLDQVKQGDRYLVEALLTNREAVLVSTDQALVECLKAKSQPVYLRDKFLQEYLKTQAH